MGNPPRFLKVLLIRGRKRPRKRSTIKDFGRTQRRPRDGACGPHRMTTHPTLSVPLDEVPRVPACLGRILSENEERRTRQALRELLEADDSVGAEFLRLARTHLPGRPLIKVSEAVGLLDDVVGRRLALLAACAHWTNQVLADRPERAPLLRHLVASASAAEPLGRTSGVVEPLRAYSLGLLHHVGDVIAMVSDTSLDDADATALGAQLLDASGVPANIVTTLRGYGLHIELSDDLTADSRILAAAEHAATEFGYAAPSVFPPPPLRSDVPRLSRELVDQQSRVCKSIEDAISSVFRAVDRPLPAPAPAPSSLISPLSHVDGEGVSSRDLGPLPVLLARISDGRDPESVEVATVAGLVEELGVERAYFLRMEKLGRMFVGGILCSRGSVPLPLGELGLSVDALPRPMRVALSTGRPILHGGELGELEFLNGKSSDMTYYVPVTVDRQHLGIIGVDVTQDYSVSPDLLASVAAHCALARQAADLRKLSDEAKTDELTGLFNRRGISDVLDRCLDAADTKCENLAIALIDCDHLKMVNDNFGHLMGDEYVRRSSEVVRSALRTGDELGRYGGDEFLAVLPNANLTQAKVAIERARSAVYKSGLESADGLLLSVSIGAVVRGESGASRESLLKLADTALYKAKQKGRNAIHVLDAEQPPSLSL